MNKFPLAPANHGHISPSEARSIFRLGDYYGATAGFCLGHIQANLVVVPADLADDFEQFCTNNPAPFPLLYRSKPGEVSAPLLATDSDVRSDLPRYIILSHGRQVHDMRDLLGFDWTDRVSFYIGCSFSFEEALIKNGVNLQYVKESKNVVMYYSDVLCCDVNGRFAGTKMVVSMRPISKGSLQKAVTITSLYPKAHGAPVHIGDPKMIGISDILKPDFGDVSTFNEREDIFVFWGCGVTGKQTMETSKADLAFTHYPGSMFITDIPATPTIVHTDESSPSVVVISPPRFPFHASLVSERTIKKIQQLENTILHDPGNCGVNSIRVEGDFLKSVVHLSHCKSVGVIFGFPCNLGFDCTEETDGPPGALAIAKALQYLNKNVAIISEERNRNIIESSVELMIVDGSLASEIPFVSCKEVIKTGGKEFDCLISIERVGQAKDGSHYSMKGVDLTSSIDQIDDVFLQASKDCSVVTIGIGDRGNELGLGQIQDKVVDHLPNSEIIGCNVPSDYAILAGVSNWAGYAIAVGLYLLVSCPVHWRYLKHGIDCDMANVNWRLEGCVQTDLSVRTLLKHMNDLGVRDGISKSLDQSVDGIPLKDHLDIIQKLRLIAID